MNGPSISFPDPPRVDLDRTIADLVAAAGAVLNARGRLRELLSANHAITAELDLELVLQTIAALRALASFSRGGPNRTLEPR